MQRLLGWSRWLIFFGLALLAISVYSGMRGPGKVPSESALSRISGEATAAREVSTKTRKSNVPLDRYIELDLSGPGGAVTVRLAGDTPASRLTGLGGQTLQARYDASNHNLLYSLHQGDEELVSYASVAAFQREQLQRGADSKSSDRNVALGMLALGIAGLMLRRKLGATA